MVSNWMVSDIIVRDHRKLIRHSAVSYTYKWLSVRMHGKFADIMSLLFNYSTVRSTAIPVLRVLVIPGLPF